MAGLVQTVLTDDELQRLVVWYGALVIVAGENTPEDDALANKIDGWRDSVACKPRGRAINDDYTGPSYAD